MQSLDHWSLPGRVALAGIIRVASVPDKLVCLVVGHDISHLQNKHPISIVGAPCSY